MRDASVSKYVFSTLLKFRWIVVIVAIGLIGLTGSFLPKIERDTTSNSFIPQDQPALLYKDKVEDVFGLTDPLIIAIVDRERGIYSPDTLALVDALTRDVKRVSQIDPDRVTSLATENNITGTADGIVTEGFLDGRTELFKAPIGTQARADEIQRAISDFPLLQGALVARDGSATIVAAELLHEDLSTAAYDAFLAIVDSAEIPDGVEVHVAGEGAVSGYLSTYIDQDARRLNPLAALIITAVLLIAFMSLRAAILPNLIVLATVFGSFGLMAASGTSFFVVTNGLVVNLIGIAVADSIHIVSEYYTRLRANPTMEKKRLVAETMSAMWRPVTLTTLTTIAGFLALAFSSVMPPIYYFGLFGALGVFLAWVYSMTMLPALLTIWPTKRLPRPFRRANEAATSQPNVTERAMSEVGRVVLSAPKTVLAAALLATLIASIGASRVAIEEVRIENFQPSEPIFKADRAINATMDGVYNLDVLVEADAPEGLFEPEALRRIETLQSYMETLPGVNGTTSIVDYVKQLHRSVQENDPSAYAIPDDPALIAQLFFLYNASADPTDFEEEVDYDYQRALVRARVNEDSFSNNKRLVPALQNWIEGNFNDETLTATTTGRLTVNYYWMTGIEASNLLSILASFAAVTLMAMLVFRSAVAGAIAVLPVGLAVLCVYGVMGFFGIPLGVGTSMFAAIAIGLSVDFAIHALDKIRELTRRSGFGQETLVALYPATGRALLFNFVALAGGFGVLATSDVPPLVNFGSLVTVAVSIAFIASVTVLPAMVSLLKPSALTTTDKKDSPDAVPSQISV